MPLCSLNLGFSERFFNVIFLDRFRQFIGGSGFCISRQEGSGKTGECTLNDDEELFDNLPTNHEHFPTPLVLFHAFYIMFIKPLLCIYINV